MSKSLKLPCPIEFGGVREIGARIGAYVCPDGWYASNQSRPAVGERLIAPKDWQTDCKLVLPSRTFEDHFSPVEIDVTGRSIQYFDCLAYVRVRITWLGMEPGDNISHGWMRVEEDLNVTYPNYDSSLRVSC